MAGDNEGAIVMPPDPPSITCPNCGATSYNPNDIREGYCGNCHDFTSPRKALAEEAGLDVTKCEFCDGDLMRPWKRGLDGAAAHLDCLAANGVAVEAPGAYVVAAVNGPANGHTHVQFVPPDERIRFMRNPPDRAERHGEWMHVPLAWPSDAGETVVYKRDLLPLEVKDINITVDGDWFVPYEVVE